jgi:RNA polymerase sigma-70 factor (ECF subfamily)
MSKDDASEMSGRDRGERFVSLYSRVEIKLHAFIVAQLPSWSDAEEVLHQTSLILWRKFDDFSPGSNFFAWARKIATYEVLKYRKRLSRDQHLFSEEVLARIEDQFATGAEQFDLERSALAECQQRLSADQFALLCDCYQDDTTIKEVAERMGRTVTSLYKQLNRIRRTLLDCIERTVRRWQHA